MSADSSNSSLTLEGIDDVEDFTQENEGERSISRERYAHLCELVHMGNNAFRDKRFDEVETFDEYITSVMGRELRNGNHSAFHPHGNLQVKIRNIIFQGFGNQGETTSPIVPKHLPFVCNQKLNDVCAGGRGVTEDSLLNWGPSFSIGESDIGTTGNREEDRSNEQLCGEGYPLYHYHGN